MRDARSSTEGRRETLGRLLEGLTARHASTNRACFLIAVGWLVENAGTLHVTDAGHDWLHAQVTKLRTHS